MWWLSFVLLEYLANLLFFPRYFGWVERERWKYCNFFFFFLLWFRSFKISKRYPKCILWLLFSKYLLSLPQSPLLIFSRRLHISILIPFIFFPVLLSSLPPFVSIPFSSSSFSPILPFLRSLSSCPIQRPSRRWKTFAFPRAIARDLNIHSRFLLSPIWRMRVIRGNRDNYVISQGEGEGRASGRWPGSKLVFREDGLYDTLFSCFVGLGLAG